MSTITEKLKALDKGQKSKVGIIFIALIIIIYMLADMMGESSVSQNPIRKAGAISKAASVPVSQPHHEEEVAQVTKLQQAVVTPSEGKEVVIPEKPRRSQSHYLQSMDQLKQLEITQKIEALKNSIAQARLNQLQTQKDIKTLTAPPPEPVVMTPKAEPAVSELDDKNVSSTEEFKLLYVANEESSWEAVLGLKGKFYNVSIGTTLPDGRTVISISGTSIDLTDGNTKTTLSITPVI
jgi:Na+-transporting methylmalonyl-CoA/oxaloacetate decarboxylase gamma subunit